MPKISVVIPVYNKAKYLAQTIQSVLEQDFTDFELILIDDGSTDASDAIIRKFNDHRLKTYKQANQGVAIARNKGVSLASSPLIAFLDADDIWFSNHLSEIYSLYQNFPDAVFFGTAYKLNFKNKRFKVVFPFEKSQIQLKPYYKYDLGQALFYMSNFAIKKDVFIREKGFKAHIDAEDTEFFIRIGLRYPMAYSQSVTMEHLNEADNSLFQQYKLEKKMQLLDFFKVEAQKDPNLQRYLDIHRYAWIIELLLAGETSKAQKLKQEIDLKHLNYKQKLLIRLPSFATRFLKNIQNQLNRLGFYYTPFSN